MPKEVSNQPQPIIQLDAQPQGSPERPTLPQKSALSRAVERTRHIYERNGWVFLPFSESGKDSPMLPSRRPTTIFSAPSHDHLVEEPKKIDINQPPHEEAKDPPNLPQPQSEPKQQARERLDRDMRELMQQIGDRKLFFEMLGDAMAQKVKRMSKEERERELERLKVVMRIHMLDMDPKNSNYLRRLSGDPLDPSLADEELQRLLNLPSSDEPTSGC